MKPQKSSGRKLHQYELLTKICKIFFKQIWLKRKLRYVNGYLYRESYTMIWRVDQALETYFTFFIKRYRCCNHKRTKSFSLWAPLAICSWPATVTLQRRRRVKLVCDIIKDGGWHVG